MSINVGDKLPSARFKTIGSEGIVDVAADGLFGAETSVLFAVPGAFTPTCSAKHLPGFVDHTNDFKAKGVRLVACTSVNDAFVMDAWAKDANAGDDIMMLADGNADFAIATGLQLSLRERGFGIRSKRYAMIIDAGIVKKLFIEQPGAFEVSSATNVLSYL